MDALERLIVSAFKPHVENAEPLAAKFSQLLGALQFEAFGVGVGPDPGDPRQLIADRLQDAQEPVPAG